MLRIPTGILGIENFDERAITIEGWFFHEKVQFATLFDSYDLAVRSYSERSWRRDAQGKPVQLPENGIGISFGNKNYLITTEEGVWTPYGRRCTALCATLRANCPERL